MAMKSTKSVQKRGRFSTKNGLKKSQNSLNLDKPESLPAPLQKLHLRLTSPRLRAPGTLTTYLGTGARFLSFLGSSAKNVTPDDFRRYFTQRRQNEISERTLQKEFFILKKLAQANQWEWPFVKEDTPYVEEEAEGVSLSPDTIELLIKAHPLYTKPEKFYLAISTTFGCRREELHRINKRDCNIEYITIFTAKHGKKKKHPIPDVLKPLLDAYRPSTHNVSSLTCLFARICKKAGYDRKPRESFHAIRHGFVTALEWKCAENRVPLSVVGDYMGWKKATIGMRSSGSAMQGIYSQHSIMSEDPDALDRLVYKIHPFLDFWKGVTGKNPPAAQANA